MSIDFDTRAGQRYSGREQDPRAMLPAKKHQEAQFSEDILREYDGHRQQWIKQAMEDDLFRNNVQWSQADVNTLKDKQQFPIVVNVIHHAVEMAKAMLTSKDPSFSATGREDSDREVGRMWADILSYVWYISSGKRELKQTIDYYYVRGMGAFLVYGDRDADFGKGEVYIKALDPFEVYVSPNTRDPYGDDSPHSLIARTFTRSMFEIAYPYHRALLKYAERTTRNRYPAIDRVAMEDQQLGPVENTAEDHFEVIERYSKVKLEYFTLSDYTDDTDAVFKTRDEMEIRLGEPAFVVLNKSDLQPRYITNPERVAELMQIYQETGGVFHYVEDPATGQPQIVPGPESEDPSAVPGSETAIQLITVKDALDAGMLEILPFYTNKILRVVTVGGQLMYRSVLPCSHQPIVLLPNRHNGNPYPMSDVRFVRPIQEGINKMRSLIIAHATSSTNVKVFIPEGSVNKDELRIEFAKAGTGVIPFNPEFGPPVVAGPVPFAGELYHYEDAARADIERIFGLYAFQQGDVSSAPDTYKGTVALEEMGQRRMKAKLDDIEMFLNHVAKIVVEYVQATYSEHKVIRLLQPNHAVKETSLNQPIYDEYTKEVIGRINDVTQGAADVIVVSGSTLPSNRWARAEYYKELYKEGIIDQVEVLKQTDVADVEGVLARSSQIAKMQQMIEQLQGELKKVSGDLQTSERESLHDRKRLEVEKFKGNLHRVETDAAAATKVYKERLSDQTKLNRQGIAPEDEAESVIGQGLDGNY